MLPTKSNIANPTHHRSLKHRHRQRVNRKKGQTSTVVHVKIRPSTGSNINNSIKENGHVGLIPNIPRNLSGTLPNSCSQLTSNAPRNVNMTNDWSIDRDITVDYHRKLKKTEKQKCTRRCVFIPICGVFLITIITIILLALLLKPYRIRNSKAAILRWNPSGITIAGTGILGTGSNQLNFPWDIVVDGLYTIYVTDRNNNRVQKFLMGSNSATTIAGQDSGISGSNLTQLNQPTGIYLDDHGNMYISDMMNQRVLFWPKDASSGSIFAGQTGVAGNMLTEFNLPHSVGVSINCETVFIADYNNNRIMSFFENNSSGTIAAGGNGGGAANTQVWNPHAAYYDSWSNSLLVANYGANNIVSWVLGASNWTLVVGSNNGTSGTTSALLSGPTDVMLDPMGNMYVVDRSNHRVQFFLFGQSNGTTIAGITGEIGNNSTMFNYSSSLTLDNQLNLYVVDRFNNRIQKFLRY